MHWLRRLFQKRQAENQLDAELRFHLEKQISHDVASGMAPEEARRRAHLDFGGLESIPPISKITRTLCSRFSANFALARKSKSSTQSSPPSLSAP
jgi:hypothetical protein